MQVSSPAVRECYHCRDVGFDSDEGGVYHRLDGMLESCRIRSSRFSGLAGEVMKRLGNVVGLATELGVAMGLTAAGAVVLGLLVGRWVDRQLGLAPFATILLAVAGAIGGQIAVYRLAVSSVERLADQRPSHLIGRRSLPALLLGLKALFLSAVPGLVGMALGLGIDGVTGTRPLFTIICMLLGFALGMVGVLRLVMRSRQETEGR